MAHFLFCARHTEAFPVWYLIRAAVQHGTRFHFIFGEYRIVVSCSTLLHVLMGHKGIHCSALHNSLHLFIRVFLTEHTTTDQNVCFQYLFKNRCTCAANTGSLIAELPGGRQLWTINKTMSKIVQISVSQQPSSGSGSNKTLISPGSAF